MTEQRIPSQWQLQNTGEPLDQWMLHEEEQRLPEHMQLHQDPNQAGQSYPQQGGYQPGDYPQQGYQQGYQQGGYQQGYPNDAAWQPIDYRAMQQAAQRPANRGGRILGGLLIVLLLGVGGYLAWFYAGQPNLFGDDTLAPIAPAEPTLEQQLAANVEATPNPVVPAVVAQEPPTPEPTQPPTVTPQLVEIRRVTINSEFGLNARGSASADGAALGILDNGASFLVANGPATGVDGGQWYEIVMTDNSRAYVSAEFVTPASEFVAFDDATRILTTAGLPAPAPAVAATTTTTETSGLLAGVGVSATAPSTATGVVGGSTPLTVETTTRTADAPQVITVSAVISAPAGLNLRSAPVAGENVIQIISDTLPIDVIGRSLDTEWLQIQLADGVRGWVAAPFVNPASALDVIPLGTTQPLTPTVPLIPVGLGADAESAATETAAVTTTTPATGTAASIGVGAASAGDAETESSATVTSTATTTDTTPAVDIASAPEVVVTSLVGVNLRSEPLEAATSTQTLEWNTAYPGLGRTADSAWVQVQVTPGVTGWIDSSEVLVQGGLAALPVIEP